MKTKAEQALVAEFEKAEARLGGAGWVRDLRRRSIATFADRGLPHRRIEEWKYTDLRERIRDVAPPAGAGGSKPARAALDAALGALAELDCDRLVFVDGHFSPDLSAASLGESVEAMPLGALLAAPPPWLEAKFAWERVAVGDAVTALNLAFMTDGILVKIKAGRTASRAILIVSVASGRETSAISLRHLLSLEAGARATVIEAHVALGGAPVMANVATDVDVARGASLAHVKVVPDGRGLTHLADWRVRVGEGAAYGGFQLTAGTALARNEIRVDFTGPDAKLDLSGAFLGRGSDHIDTTLLVNHDTPGCESRELFKGVLDDRASGVFQGKVVVQPVAQKTDGKQMAQALMLSPDAEFDSKPELEIYADDVACGHGSTAAEIDRGALFYLRSRGIPEGEARAMLIESFVGEAIEKIDDEAVREALMATAVGWLAARRPKA